MGHTEKTLDLPEEELLDIDQEVMEHAIWFTAEDELDSDDINEKSNKITSTPKNKQQAENINTDEKAIDPVTNDVEHKEKYHILIQKEDDNLHLLLKAHFLEYLHLSPSETDKEEFLDIIDQYHDYYDNGTMPDDIKVLHIIEANYLLDDFLEMADEYDDNPVYFLKKTTDYPMPPDMLEKAQNMDDEEIIYLFSQFCKFCSEDNESVLEDPKDIKTKDLMGVIQKLATCEQID